jgi:hypothetical protein
MEARFPLSSAEEISLGAQLLPGSDDVFASKWWEDLIYQISMFSSYIFLQALRDPNGLTIHCADTNLPSVVTIFHYALP